MRFRITVYCRKMRIIDLFFWNLHKLKVYGEKEAGMTPKNIPIVAYWRAKRPFHYQKEGQTERMAFFEDRDFFISCPWDAISPWPNPLVSGSVWRKGRFRITVYCRKMRIIDLFFWNLLKLKVSCEKEAVMILKNILIVAFWRAIRPFNYLKEGGTEKKGLFKDRVFWSPAQEMHSVHDQIPLFQAPFDEKGGSGSSCIAEKCEL